MDSFEGSTVVITRFPFSNLSRQTLRPAVVLAEAGLGDWILGQITSNPGIDSLAIELTDGSFARGSLRSVSYFRPNKLFTGNEAVITRTVAILKPEAFNHLIDRVINLLNQGRT